MQSGYPDPPDPQQDPAGYQAWLQELADRVMAENQDREPTLDPTFLHPPGAEGPDPGSTAPTGPPPPRPVVVGALSVVLALIGLIGLGTSVYLLTLPFGFAAAAGGFEVGRFVVALLFIGLFAVMLGVLGYGFGRAGYRLWTGRERDPRGVGRAGRIGALFFLLLLAAGVRTQSRTGGDVLPDLAVILLLGIPAAVLLLVGPLYRLPAVGRYLAQSQGHATRD